MTQAVSGYEFFSGHFGVDFTATPWFAFGPYVSVSLGSYGSIDGSCRGDCEGVTTFSGSITDSALHTWAFFGMRALFQLAGKSSDVAPQM